VQSPAPVRYVNTTPVQQGTQTIQTSTIHTSSSAIVPTTYSNTSSTQPIYTRVDSNCATNGIGCQPVSVTAAHQQPIIAQAHTPSHQAEPLLLATHQNEPVNNVFASPNAQNYAPSLTENTYSADSIGTPGYEAVRQSQSLSADNSYASQTIAPVISQAPSNSTAFASAPLTSNSGASHSGGFTGQPLVNTAPPIVPVVTPQNIPAWPQAHTSLGTNYTIKAGDTVYSLSRSICSSVSAVQTLNNLDQNFSIQVGQTLQLPASAC